jgi:hypothetical protein
MQALGTNNELFHDDTYEIPIGNLALLIPKLERLNRKAQRLGTEPVTYEILDRITREVTIDDITGYKRRIEFAVVSVKGERPQLEGWTFVATLMHAGEAGTIIRAVPGFDVPVQYRDATPEWCDHCKQVRQRRDTYVVYNEAAGFRQVGKNCLQDFLGGQSPQSLAAHFNWLLEVRQLFLGATGWREQQIYYLDEYLGFVVAQIEKHGWVSKKKAMETADSQVPLKATAYEALHMMLNWQDLRARAQEYPLTEWWVPTDPHKTKARNAIEAVTKSLDAYEEKGLELNDYQHNVHVVLKSPAFEWRAAGIAASIIPFYDRLVEEERARASGEKKDSQFQGEIGRQIYRKLTVLRKHVRYVEQQDKDASIVGFVDDDQNEYVWFASRLVDEWEEGQELFIRATVKNHMASRIGINQTVLTYVREVSEPEYRAATQPRLTPAPSTVARAAIGQLPPNLQQQFQARPTREAPTSGTTDSWVTLYRSLDIYDEIKNQPISRQARALKARGYNTATIAKMLQKSYQQIYQAVGKS